MKFRPVHMTLILFLLFALLSWANTWEGTEHALQDRFYQAANGVDDRIVIISIDDESLNVLGKRWPWPRSYHADLLNILAQGEPAAIGFDVIFSEPADDPQEDQALIAALEAARQTILPSYGIFGREAERGALQAQQLVEPLPEIAAVSRQGHINTFPDSDGVVRRVALSIEHAGQQLPSFAWAIYGQYLESIGEEQAVATSVPTDQWGRMLIDYTGEPGAFEPISYHRVLSGEVPPEYFYGAIVLVGPYSVGIDDYYYTPLASEVPMHGVEIHANILQNLLHGNHKARPSFIADLAVLALLGAAGWFLFNRLSPGKAALALIGLLGLYLYAATQAYRHGIVLQLFYPMSFLAVSYLVTLAYRYIAEMLERKRVTDVFGRYVAPQVVSKVLAEGEAGLRLGGVRKELTALFVDIRGFTPLSERASPEEVVELLNSYLNLCAHSIFEVGGTLDKFMGDATMALFNAPLTLPDHAFQACRAAWLMKEGSRSLQADLERRFGRTVQFGVGINTGEAVVGNIGADFRMDYTAIGDTINTAARLESNAQPGQILLSQATYDMVKDRVIATSLGSIKVKGKDQEVPIYQLEGMRESDEKWHA